MKNFSLLLLAFIATQANGRLVCKDNSNFCQIVADFDKELTWEKSKPIDSNQEYEEQDYGVSLQKDGDALLTKGILPMMENKYQQSSLQDISEEVITLAKEIRNKESNLYELAKSVGRIDKINTPYCGAPGMGTATLVKWKDMPSTMEGRVVLTCLHNHNYSNQTVTPSFPKSAASTASNWRKRIDQEAKKYEYGNKNEYFMLDCKNVYFTPDENNDKINVRGYGKTERSIEVSHCYYKAKDERSNHDIAIFILKDKVDCVTPVEIFQSDLANISLKENDILIGVGYGRSNADHETDSTRFLDGWNIKKKINTLCKPEGDLLKLKAGTGSGDSGSLLFTTNDGSDPNEAQKEDKLVAIGIATGATGDPMLYQHMEWMKAAVQKFAEEEKEFNAKTAKLTEFIEETFQRKS